MNPRFLSEVPFTDKQGEEQIGGKEVGREGNLNCLSFRIFFLPMSEFFKSGPKHCKICQCFSYILQKNGH